MRKYFAEAVGAPGGALRCQVFRLRVFRTRNVDRLLGGQGDPVARYSFLNVAALHCDSVFVDPEDPEGPGDVVRELWALCCAVLSVEEDVVLRRDPSRRLDALVKVALVARLIAL